MEKSHSEDIAFRTNGYGWCIPMLGITASNQTSAHSWSSGSVTITGPTILPDVWTHLVTTYSQLNGLRLWVNGTLINPSPTFIFAASNVANTLTLGALLPCAVHCVSGGIDMGQFYGAMDELCVYAKELNETEVSLLARP